MRNEVRFIKEGRYEFDQYVLDVYQTQSDRIRVVFADLDLDVFYEWTFDEFNSFGPTYFVRMGTCITAPMDADAKIISDTELRRLRAGDYLYHLFKLSIRQSDEGACLTMYDFVSELSYRWIVNDGKVVLMKSETMEIGAD